MSRSSATKKQVKRISSKEMAVESPDIASEELDLEAALANPAATEVSEEFIGQWHTLISTTNWEKGRIIAEWRSALFATEAPAKCYSDEAWTRRVGGVTAQHVGRLRRVYDRFGSSYTSYPKVYWSHFLATLEWDDAEMWLEGASRSGWSVSEMRGSRAEALGLSSDTVDQESATAEEIASQQIDEDYEPLAEMASQEDLVSDAEKKDRVGTTGPTNEGPDFGDEDQDDDDRRRSKEDQDDDDDMPFEANSPRAPLTNPFASLPQLPADVAEALELFKLAVVRHRNSHWEEVSQAHVLQVLDALRSFASHTLD